MPATKEKNRMWIVAYILNDKQCHETFDSYPLALFRYGQLCLDKMNPSIHERSRRPDYEKEMREKK